MRQFQYLKIPFASTEELFHSRAYGSGTCIQPPSLISLKDKEKEGVKGWGGVGGRLRKKRYFQTDIQTLKNHSIIGSMM